MGEPDKVIIKIDKRSKNIYFMKEIDFYNDKDEHKKEERQQKKESQDNFKKIITNYIRSIEAFKKAGLTINNVSPVIISIIIKDTLLPIISRDKKHRINNRDP
ncbi:MAG: hypothetical protein ACFCUR_18370 [Rhodomicrobiaceae bacterium]